MTYSSLDAIEMIRRHQKSAPVEVVPLAADLGVNCYKVEGWPADTSGMIVRDAKKGGSSGFSIYVNAAHPDVRRRFTIAHELAHFVLHRSLIGDGIKDDGLYRSGLSDAVEVEANRLAAEILMPAHLVRRYISEGVTGPTALSRLFKVSQRAMEIRLDVLGHAREAA